MIKKVLPFIALIVLLVSLSSVALLPSSNILKQRELININKNWQYLEDNIKDIQQIDKAKEWKAIDLPHSWNQWDAVDNSPGYRRDASWYKKEMQIPLYDYAQYILYFEGANISTTVYVNGIKAGAHTGGYVGFEIDVTNHIKKGKNNRIDVRVDNSYNPDIIPSQKADFFIFGGITRDVWLKILPQVNLKNIHITTPNVNKTSADTEIKIDFHNAGSLNKNYHVRCQIIEPGTTKILSETKIKANEIKQGKGISLPPVNNPKLWSTDHPNLYEVKTQLLDGDTVVDEKMETIGYRWFRFDDYGAFFLNDERLLLRGTHRHEEHAGFGAAMPNNLHRKDIEMMKDMGVNFLRLGHYPQDPVVYKACNELGIIVWDELPWCRGGMGGEQWKANTKRLLEEQINQNYNHPSILFWSLGNEIYWLPDFVGGDDRNKLNSFVSELNDLSHKLDPYRMTSIRKYYDGSDLVDVFSPSIWSGWYAGVYTNYQKTIEENQKKYKRFLHMEYGGSSHVGRHTENPITGAGTIDADDWEEASNQVNIDNIAKNGDWTENYIVDLFDWHLGVTEQKTDFGGNAQWAFKDFGTPLRPENAIPYMNQKGLVDRDGNPKDAFYVFKSYWSKEPMVYIESDTWTHRTGPEGKPRELSVYSNCNKVELFHNGNSLGTKDRDISSFPACGLTWSVLFTEGDNQLIAKGYKSGKLVTEDDLSVNYTYKKADKPNHIEITHERLDNGNYMVHAIVRDAKKNRILDYEDRVYFAVDGAGEFMKYYGTPSRSDIIEMANGHASCELIPGKGKAYIEVRNQSFKGSYHIIDFGENNYNKEKSDDTK